MQARAREETFHVGLPDHPAELAPAMTHAMLEAPSRPAGEGLGRGMEDHGNMNSGSSNLLTPYNSLFHALCNLAENVVQ